MASRHRREKRAARRSSIEQAPAGHSLLRHVRYCRCIACEERRRQAIKEGIPQTAARIRDYAPAHPHPEHKRDWPATAHALSAYMALHEVTFDRRCHATHFDLKPEFVAHLDGHLGATARELDAGRLYEALLLLEALPGLAGPLRARLIRACAIEGCSQAAIAAREGMNQSSVSRHLEAGLQSLLEIYGGLLLVEGHQASS